MGTTAVGVAAAGGMFIHLQRFKKKSILAVKSYFENRNKL